MQKHNAQPLLLECLSVRTAKSRLENQALNCQSIARLPGKMLPVVDELALEVQFWVVLRSPVSHMREQVLQQPGSARLQHKKPDSFSLKHHYRSEASLEKYESAAAKLRALVSTANPEQSWLKSMLPRH